MKAKGCSFKFLVTPDASKNRIDWNEEFHRSAPLDVEIGFGMGENLMRMAREMPERNFIGIEQNWERICKTLKAVTREQSASPELFKNIRILTMDARAVFALLFAEKSIDNIYCLFPCPWPKKGHAKHRLFARDFLRTLNNRLKKAGGLEIVTDFYPYFEWILEQAKQTGFRVETKTVEPRYGTKFERKWREEGQEEFFELHLAKTKHITIPSEEDVSLKNYTLKSFDVDRLQLDDAKRDICVIFKEVLFDQKKQKAMIHAFVTEKYLEQHFWVAVTKKQKIWHLAKAEGQNFLPTEGIAKALDLVYEAAKKTS